MLSRLESGLRLSGYEPGKQIVVAYSGGPDSTALTLGLSQLLSNDTPIAAAHFNHRARGPESDADEQFVREFCAQLGIPLHVERAPTQSDGISEGEARELRYCFLQRVAVGLDAPFVAVAHTADDQAETVLLRISRGTGLRGLAAMPYSRPIAEGSRISVIRPMLDITRAEVSDFLKERGITPRHDASNDDVRYARNRIRHHVLPALKAINPAAVQAITRLAKIAREHDDFIEAEVEAAARQFKLPNLNGIQALPTPIAVRLLTQMHSQSAAQGAQLEQHHIEAALQLAARDSAAELHLPGNVVLTHRAGETTLSVRECPDNTVAAPIEEATLPIPGSVDLSNGSSMTADVVPPPESFADAPRRGQCYAYIARDIASEGQVLVRARLPGDRYLPLGMTHEVKVQNMMVDAKVPRELRESTPLVVAPDAGRGRIAWVVGFPPADWARVRSDDASCVKLAFKKATSS